MFAGITVFYGIIVIHDIPYEFAVHRNHPHQNARLAQRVDLHLALGGSFSEEQ